MRWHQRVFSWCNTVVVDRQVVPLAEALFVDIATKIRIICGINNKKREKKGNNIAVGILPRTNTDGLGMALLRMNNSW